MLPGQGGPSNDSASSAGPSGSHVFESEIRTEPQIRQYIPPSPALLDEENMEAGDLTFQQSSTDGNFTWVCIISPLRDSASS